MDEDYSIPEKVETYERFLNEVLRNDLIKVLDERDKIYSKLSEYLQLRNVIESLQDVASDSKVLKTKVDLGCNFYVQAKIADCSRIYVCVGFGFYVEFTHSEAIKFINKKVKLLEECCEEHSKQSAKIKAHIKFVIEGLRELQLIDDAPPQKAQRNIYE